MKRPLPLLEKRLDTTLQGASIEDSRGQQRTRASRNTRRRFRGRAARRLGTLRTRTCWSDTLRHTTQRRSHPCPLSFTRSATSLKRRASPRNSSRGVCSSEKVKVQSLHSTAVPLSRALFVTYGPTCAFVWFHFQFSRPFYL